MNAAPRGLAAAPDGLDDRRALAFLAELSQALALSIDLNKTLAMALGRIAQFMQAEAASMFLVDPASGLIECRQCVGPVNITGLKVQSGQGIVGRAVAENTTQIVRDAQTDSRVNVRVDAETGFITRSIICVPLTTAEGPIGAIEVINRVGGGLFEPADAELLRTIAAPAALAVNNARLVESLVEQQRIRRELDLARRVQKSLLPKRRRDKFPLIGINLPAHEISGDFYDYFDLPDGRIAFVIGDISGKGLDAAFLMVRVASLLRWVGKEGTTPARWLERANAELCQTLREGRFVCALVGQYDRVARSVVFASAGFPPALLQDDGGFREYPADGPPLGVLPDVGYGEQRVELGRSALYFFSDGATDARRADASRIDSTGLRELIVRHLSLAPEPRLRALIGDLKQLDLVDDTTILLLQEPRGANAQILLDLQFPAHAAQMRSVRARLRETLDEQAVGPEMRDQLVLAVDEACTNIIRHAYCQAIDCAGTDETISLLLTRERDMLVFELRDEAPPVDPGKITARDLGECRPGGLGVPFIRTLMDEWELQPGPGGNGNILRMRKRLQASGTGDTE
ncbi:MAG TPA: SpoIIE family protein phosphatase [Rudaea sp.]|nr:SpoIIE family protein phosphatase [Rudaea sp.]